MTDQSPGMETPFVAKLFAHGLARCCPRFSIGPLPATYQMLSQQTSSLRSATKYPSNHKRLPTRHGMIDRYTALFTASHADQDDTSYHKSQSCGKVYTAAAVIVDLSTVTKAEGATSKQVRAKLTCCSVLSNKAQECKHC